MTENAWAKPGEIYVRANQHLNDNPPKSSRAQLAELRKAIQAWEAVRVKSDSAELVRVPILGKLFRMLIRATLLGHVWAAEAAIYNDLLRDLESRNLPSR